ncbi:T-cell surface glycoprotein CD3 zeta chain-like [Hippoglossus hippoglossus]|uniref:T-cell surface glycoprotein CD3 zeta chain-like n=1 Tax=Hippoglossus hippoglossus TaxID=8267 RepID=UPI00148B53F2|nr:T-cell surface glycoprotein CD3 zeta chain-like [Hippoglossus hippoglossus]
MRIGVFLLFLLLVPVSCRGSVDIMITEPVVCFFLDGILIIYCIVVTALFFKEKLSIEPVEPEVNGRIYEELRRPMDADPYAMLEPSKRRKRAKKRKKPESTQPEQREDEALISAAPPSAQSPP